MLTVPASARVEARDDPQQRGLAAAGRPEQRGQLAGRDGDVDVVEGDEVAELLGDAGDVDAHDVLSFGLGRSSATTTRQAMLTRTSRKAIAYAASCCEVLVLLLDHEGGGLGLAGDVAGHDLDRAELTERTGPSASTTP